MTAGGMAEVETTARIVADERIKIIYASDLGRTMNSAAIISDENVGYPPIVPARQLRSWDMGAAMEGKVTTPEVIALIVSWVLNDTVVPPGGESFRSYAKRVIDFVSPIFGDAVGSGEMCAIMTHGRTVQIIDFWIAAGCDEECMHREFKEFLADEPDIVPPGGGIRYKHDGLGWLGIIVPTGEVSLGTAAASGAVIASVNDVGGSSGSVPS
jgi:broad specificity phosphatase PhoE